MECQRGYHDTITLTSPAGKQRLLRIPGRIATEYDPHTGHRSNKRHITLTAVWMNKEEKEKRIRQDRVLQRLLSAGWNVAQQSRQNKDQQNQENGMIGEEDKKDTDVVIGTMLTGDASHGGDHASGEVEDSPNHMKRGCRGQRSANSKQNRIEKKQNKERDQKSASHSLERRNGSGIFSPQPMRIDSKIIASTEKSAELLKCIIGKSDSRMPQGLLVDAEKLLIALETGDNPLPPLETPHEVPRLRVIITPDCSGSTQNWSGIGRGWAHHISYMQDIEVVYIENMNGDFVWRDYGKPPSAVETFLQEADLLVYLGDGDGYNLCHSYAEKGARVIALDCRLASVAKPRLKEMHQKSSTGELYWIDRVSAKDPMTWFKALTLVLST